MRVLELGIAGIFVAVTCFFAYATTTPHYGCPPISKVPKYDCQSRPRAADDCSPYDGEGPSGIGYPQGCTVTTPYPDVMSRGCGPQTCYCSMIVGTKNPAWICPV